MENMVKGKIKTFAAAAALMMMVSATGLTAFAAEDYSYLAGQRNAQSRNALYEQAEAIESEEERRAFLAEHGIDDMPYSEENAQTYSYISGQQRGASYRTEGNDTDAGEFTANYRYIAGRQRGSGYQK